MGDIVNIEEDLLRQNDWWISNEPPNPEYGKVSDYDTFLGQVVGKEKKDFTAISGARTVGKTTLLKHMIADIIQRDNSLSSNNILYLTVDNPFYHINAQEQRDIITQAVQWYTKNILKSHNGDSEYYVFLDDIHTMKLEIEEEDITVDPDTLGPLARQITEILKDERANLVLASADNRKSEIITELVKESKEVSKARGNDCEATSLYLGPRRFLDEVDHRRSGKTTDRILDEVLPDVRRNILTSTTGSHDEIGELVDSIKKAEESILDNIEDGHDGILRYLNEYRFTGGAYQNTSRDIKVSELVDIASKETELSVYKDIAQVKEYREVTELHALCKHLAEDINPETSVQTESHSYSELSDKLAIDRQTLSSYLNVLDDYNIINIVYPYDLSIRRSFRTYFPNPTDVFALLDKQGGTEDEIELELDSILSRREKKLGEGLLVRHLELLYRFYTGDSWEYSVSYGNEEKHQTADLILNIPEKRLKNEDDLGIESGSYNVTPSVNSPIPSENKNNGGRGSEWDLISIPVTVAFGDSQEAPSERMQELIEETDRFRFGLVIGDNENIDEVKHTDLGGDGGFVSIPDWLFMSVC
jgi:predicted AAA+ superfamily ATPase